MALLPPSAFQSPVMDCDRYEVAHETLVLIEVALQKSKLALERQQCGACSGDNPACILCADRRGALAAIEGIR